MMDLILTPHEDNNITMHACLLFACACAQATGINRSMCVCVCIYIQAIDAVARPSMDELHIGLLHSVPLTGRRDRVQYRLRVCA